MLRHINVSACLHGRKHNVRVGCNAENVVLKVLELEREDVQLSRAERIGVIHDKAVQLVVVSVAARQVGIAGIGNLIIGRVVLLECVAVAHRLFTADGIVDLYC